MKRLPWAWIVAGLAVAVLLGAIWQGKKTWAELLDDNSDLAERNERHQSNEAVLREALQLISTVEGEVRDSAEDAELRHEQHEVALRGQLRVAIGNQAPELAADFDEMTAASDSSLMACRTRCDSFEKELKASAELHVAKDSSFVAMRDDRDYWKDAAKAQTTDFSLNGWLPEGWIRTTGTVLMCGVAGVGVGALAKSPEAGAGTWGGCTVAAFVF